LNDFENENSIPITVLGEVILAETPNQENNQTIMPAPQINAKLLYLYQIVQDNYHFGIQILHSQVCKAHQSHLQLLRMMAAGGQPSVLVRTLMRSPGYKATTNGDLLEIYKCETITDYMFLPQTGCILEWPIEFYSGQERKSGYLTGITHEILDEPTPTICPAPNFYFEYGNVTVHLTNRTVVETFPTLPSSYDDVSMKKMPDLSFESPGIYTVEEISGTETITGLLKNLNRQSRIDAIIQAHIRGDELTSDQIFSMQVLREYLISPLKNSVAIICGVSVLLVLGFISIKFCYRNKQVISGRFNKRVRSKSNYKRRQSAKEDIEADYISLEEFQEPVNAISLKRIKRLALTRAPKLKPRPKSALRNSCSKSIQTDDLLCPLSTKTVHTDVNIIVPAQNPSVYLTDELKKLDV